MIQSMLLELDAIPKGDFDLGKGYILRLPHGPSLPGDLYHKGSFSKRINLADKDERRLLVVELIQRGVNQTRMAEALNLSRQTLHNYREIYLRFGVIGLLHGYSPSVSLSKEFQGRIHVSKRRPGSKARELEALRREKMMQKQGVEQGELALNSEAATIFMLDETAIEESLQVIQPADDAVLAGNSSSIDEVSKVNLDAAQDAAIPVSPQRVPAQAIDLPYADTHGWEATRYAGIFPVLLLLISQWKWMSRLFSLYGNGWRIFHVFVLMVVRNIRSIEQLKHERREEAGRLLGLKALPGLDTVWRWFHDVAAKQRAGALLKAFFADQIRGGLVGARLWFTDGHLLPYTGQNNVHASWNTQRRMPTPGQTNLVTCDERGRVVYFDIQEGKGNLRAQILKLGDYARQQSLETPPVQVFDREGDGVEFFSKLVKSGTPFITWEKNANQAQLLALPETDFTHRTEVNGTQYRLLEQTKAYLFTPESDPATGAVAAAHPFNLRQIVLWNQRTKHRVSVLCWDAGLNLSIDDVATAMLSRWGASENTFKHLQERHPYHYHPGFAVSESDKQDIANPQIEVLAQQISTSQRDLAKLYKAYTHTKPVFNRDGSERTNSKHRRLAVAIAASETNVKRLKSEMALLPERIDVSTLTDYRSFKAIDNEGKNLFDFVTSMIWNARRQLLDWLHDSYANNNERVDLLYAIFECHGWIRCDDKRVVVRMEPLQQPARRYAQEQLCRKLSGLDARIPGGKRLMVEVGASPL